MGHTVPLWISTCLIALHSALFGIAICILGPFLKKDYLGSIHHDVPLTTVQESAAIALLLLSCIPGSFFTGVLVGRYGTKVVLLFNSFLWFIGGIFLCFSTLGTVLIGRCILGFALGISSVIPPMLLNEIASTDVKGVVANCHQLFITGGQLVIYILALWFVNIEHGWKWLNGGTFVLFGFIAFIGGFWVPESPSWLLQNGRDVECLNLLRLLRQGTLSDFFSQVQSDVTNFAKNPNIHLSVRSKKQQGTELDDIDPAIVATHQVFYGEDEMGDDNNDGRYTVNSNRQSVYDQTQAQKQQQHHSTLDQPSESTLEDNQEQDQAETNVDDPVHVEFEALKNTVKSTTRESKWIDLLLPQYRYQLLLGLGLMTLQPLIGINPVCMFATKIFSFAGLNETEAMLGTASIGLIGFTFSFITSLLVGQFGRRLLIFIGSVGCAVFLLLLSISFLGMDGVALQGMISLASCLLYLVFFNLGLGGAIWLLLSEITATAIKSKAMSLYCAVCWSYNFFLVFMTLPIMAILGGGETDEQLKVGAGYFFIFFVLVGILGALFAWFVLIDTTGKTEDQIQIELGAKDDGLKPVVLDEIDSAA